MYLDISICLYICIFVFLYISIFLYLYVSLYMCICLYPCISEKAPKVSPVDRRHESDFFSIDLRKGNLIFGPCFLYEIVDISICLFLSIFISLYLSISLYLYISISVYLSLSFRFLSLYISTNHLKYPLVDRRHERCFSLIGLRKGNGISGRCFFYEIPVPNSRREIYQKYIDMCMQTHYDFEIKIPIVKTLSFFVDFHVFLQNVCT